MKQSNLQTVGAVTKALETNTMLDAETVQEILSFILKEHNLGK